MQKITTPTTPKIYTSVGAQHAVPLPTQTVYPRLGVRRLALLALLAGLVAAFLLSLAVGSVNIPLREVVTILTGGEASRASWETIVLNFRLPKAITAVLAGAALAVSGLQMQTLFRNPLADPYVLGISSGASLGAALVVLAAGTTGSLLLAGIGLPGDFGLAAASSLGAALVLVLVMLVARRVQSVVTLLILGLMFGYVTSAIVSLLIYFSIANRVQIYLSWTFGSFGGVTWGQMQVFAPVIVIGLAAALLLVKPLNALLLGETYARSLGLNVRRARVFIIASTALLAGAVTAFCGPVGFLGIAVPHVCRAIFGTSDHRALVPASILMGGMVALLTDWVAQVPGSQVTLPLNAVTALLGAPVVIWVILRRRALRSAVGA
ncbi:MAG: iron ABC transporter permease [Chloroflexi bacterium]|nr:iron ABC transporter permease [Chloroflexota bacterium]